MKQVYLAGPMRGYIDYNFPLFLRLGKELEEKGLKVFNPAQNDIDRDGFNPKTDEARDFSYYMIQDLPAVCKSNAVLVLPGWEFSKGACLEVHVAKECDIPVFNIFDVLEGRVVL